MAAALVCVALTGCGTPAPAPSPTTTGFASEDEAFAAAEATYRAYVDALNQRRVDENSSPDPQSFLSGNALSIDIETQQQLSDLGLKILGVTTIRDLEPFERSSWTEDRLLLQVCLDQQATQVVDSSGADVTPANRPQRQGLIITMANDKHHWLVSETTTGEESTCS